MDSNVNQGNNKKNATLIPHSLITPLPLQPIIPTLPYLILFKGERTKTIAEPSDVRIRTYHHPTTYSTDLLLPYRLLLTHPIYRLLLLRLLLLPTSASRPQPTATNLVGHIVVGRLDCGRSTSDINRAAIVTHRPSSRKATPIHANYCCSRRVFIA